MRVRRFFVVFAVTTAVTVITAIAGLAANVASNAAQWPSWLEPVREHPWLTLTILVVFAAAFGVVSAGVSGASRPEPPSAALSPHGGRPALQRAISTLPPDTPMFTGRAHELDQLVAVDDRVTAKVVAIDGMAGVGKTALVVRAAHLLAAGFPDGQLFIDLHAHTAGQVPVTPAQALARLLSDLGVPPEALPAGPDVMAVTQQRAALWRSLLEGRRLLLVLDNAHSSQQIRDLLPGTPGSLVLVTSRRRLVALPATTTLEVRTLDRAQAAELFTRVAGRTPGAGQSPDLHDLVLLCGLLPLAITLLAGRMRQHSAWSFTELAARMRRGHDRLGQLHAEHLAVAAAFDLSYQALPAQRQQFLRRLGLHPGTDVDAHAAAALGDVPASTATTYLEDLYNEHLLLEAVTGRFSMHDLIREYIKDLTADEAAARDQSLARLFEYYQRTAVKAVRHLQPYARPGQSASTPDATGSEITDRHDAVEWLSTERANLLAFLAHATGNEQSARIVGLTAALADFLRFQGPWDLAITLQTTAVAHARRLGGRCEEANAMTDLAVVRYLSGDYPAATADLQDALRLYRDLGEELGQANVHAELGMTGRLSGAYPAAADNLRKALAFYRGLGERRGEALALTGIGSTQRLTGEYAAAAASLPDALTLYRDLGDQFGEADVLNELGLVSLLVGDYATSADILQTALALRRDLNDQRGEAAVLSVIGSLRRVEGDYPAAAVFQGQALALYREVGDRRGEANTLANLGAVHYVIGDYAAAAENLRHGLVRCHDLGDRRGETNALNSLGEVQRQMGDYPAATDSLRRALALSREMGERHGQANALTSLANISCLSGDTADAIEDLRQALALYAELGDPRGEANALTYLGDAQRLRGDHLAAKDSLQKALTLFRTLNEPGGEVEALNKLGVLLLAMAEPRQALEQHEGALRLSQRIHSRMDEAGSLEGIGHSLRGLGDRDRSDSHLRRALELYQQIGASADARRLAATVDPFPDNAPD